MFGPWRRHSREYLVPGRLEEVIALIQVLGLDEHVHKTEGGLKESLRELPESAGSWTVVAKRHPEFFRTYEGRGGLSVALIARHLSTKGDDGPELSTAYIHGLVEAAIQIHQGQLQRKQILRATWLVALGVMLPAVASIAASWFTRIKH